MTINKLLFVVVLFSFLLTSCEKELLEENTTTTAAEAITFGGGSSEKSTETSDAVVERMRLKNVEFLERIGESTGIPLKSAASSSAYNSGRISIHYLNFPYSNYQTLNFGARTGSTQWANLTLDNTYFSIVPDQYTNNRTGQLDITLSGVNQRLSLNFSINVATQTATVRPTTSANYHSGTSPNTSFALSGPTEVTIHSNTAGWMWVELKRAGAVVFSTLYRYNYDTRYDGRNGGNMNTYGFGPNGVGPRPPYTQASFTTRYRGYCGWF